MNCQPGDLAVVVKGDGSADSDSDLGVIVEVLRPGLDYTERGDSRFHWRCKLLGYASVDWGDGDVTQGHPGDEADYPDSCLQPIRPQPDEDEEEDELDVVREVVA